MSRLLKAGIWMAALFSFCFDNVHLLFSMKYWSLSLKIEDIMLRRQSHEHHTLFTHLIFWFAELVIIMSSVLMIVDTDISLKRDALYETVPLNVVLQISIFLPSLIALVLIIDAVFRLRRSVRSGGD